MSNTDQEGEGGIPRRPNAAGQRAPNSGSSRNSRSEDSHSHSSSSDNPTRNSHSHPHRRPPGHRFTDPRLATPPAAGSVAVPLITPRYQRKSRFFRSMDVTDSIPETQTPGNALEQQATEDMTIQNGPMRYTEKVHFHTYDLFKHGKHQIHSRSVGYSSDGDLVMMREDLSEVSDVDSIVRKKTVIYEPTVLNPRAQAPLTDSELQSRYYRRFKKKYPGIRAPRNKKIRNRLMNDYFASEDARRLLDQAREYRESAVDEAPKPFFGPLPRELESTFDVIRDEEVRAAQKYWSPAQKPVAPPLHPDSAEARLQLLNTRLRAELQRALNSEFLANQIQDLEAEFTRFLRRGDADETLVLHFRDGYGRLVCHGIAAYYCLISKTVASEDAEGTKLTYVNFPKAKTKAAPPLAPPAAPLVTVLGPCHLPRHVLSTNTTPNASPALESVAPEADVLLEPMEPLDLGPSAAMPHSPTSDSASASMSMSAGSGSPTSATAPLVEMNGNTTVRSVRRGEHLVGDVVLLYEPQQGLLLDDAEPSGFRIVPLAVLQPPASSLCRKAPVGSESPLQTGLTQTQRKKMRRAERQANAQNTS